MEQPSVTHAKRLTSLDVFRGFTILAMLIVSHPGNYSHTYSLLLHAAWDHISPADLVFPFFLFTVGVALATELRPYVAKASEASRRQRDRALYKRLARRAGVLVLLGLLIQAFPGFHLASWRIPGVLQRTAICYFVAALIFLHAPLRWQWIIGAATLIGYAALLRFVGAPGVAPGQIEQFANLPRWVDLSVFSHAHLLKIWPTDPEGLLSTPAAVVSVLLGCWVGRSLVNTPVSFRRGALVIASGFICSMFGWTLSSVLPMIKMIWTPTYVLFAGGLAMMCYGLCYLFSDLRPAERWIWGLQIFGRNAILSYVISEITNRTLLVVEFHGTSFPVVTTACIINLSGGIISPRLGSLLYACLCTFAIWCISYILYQRRWFIHV